jgi:bacterioferritin
MMKKEFLSSLTEIRRRAREKIQNGAVTENYRGDRQKIIQLLNDALATEIVCVLRYKNHYFMARGIHAEPVAREFKEHAGEEQVHADRIAERITQLGGEPDLNPEGLAARSHSEYIASGTLIDMIRENLVAERIAIDTYGEIVRYIGDQDPTSRRIMEDILAQEEEHADELADLLTTLHPSSDEPPERPSHRRSASSENNPAQAG